jgi:hypothetical protein
MSGLIVRAAPTLDGSESIGVWVDVAWSVYLEIGIQAAQFREGTDSVNELWESLTSEGDDGKPTPEQWGASERAQRGQEALMSMFGGGAMGAAPAVGDEA